MCRFFLVSLSCLALAGSARAQSDGTTDDPLAPQEGGDTTSSGDATLPPTTSAPDNTLPPDTTTPPPTTTASPTTTTEPSPSTQPSLAEREATDRERERAEEEEDDDGRKADLLWIEAGIGYSYANLVSFNDNNFLPTLDEVKGNGFTAHVAAGFRVFFLTLGARGWLATYSNFDLWSLVADIALRLPIPVVEPYFRFGIGYAFIGKADYSKPADSDVTVFGLVIEGGLGVDIYLSDIFSFGAGLDLAVLNLTRQRVDMCSGATPPTGCNPMTVDFQEDGDAAGLSLRAHGHISLHF